MKNNILFELRVTQPMSGDKRHGGGKYGEVILKRIIERGLPISCCYDSRVWFNPDVAEMIAVNHVPLYDLAKTSIDEIIKEQDIQLIYESSNLDGRKWSKVNCRVLGVIHGLRGLETPNDISEFFYKKPLKFYVKAIARRVLAPVRLKKAKNYVRASINAQNIKVMTVSHHSAASFKAFFPEYKEEIPVFYSPSTSVLETKERKYNEKYFLLVSANRPMKNNLRAIMAFDRLYEGGFLDGCRVKVTGVKGPEAFWYKIKYKDKFDFVGYVDEAELDQLYHDAYCFVYPTLNEGFGYPPIEAMHYGVPVLSSPYSSIPEVCGGNVIYFNPFSVEEIMNRIIQILDPSMHKEFSQLSRERYAYITQRQNEDLDKLIDYIYSK